MKHITVWAIMPAYDTNDNIYYQVLPYNLIGTIKNHFKFNHGLISLIPFLRNCTLSKDKAYKIQNIKNSQLKGWIENVYRDNH